MSLDWDIGDCRDYEELKSDDEWPATQNLIFSMMVAGFCDVTEDNWDRVYARVTAWGRIISPGEDDMFTPEQVHRRVGLSTNCGPELTDHRWVNQKVKRALSLDNLAHNARHNVKDKEESK